MKYTKYTVLTVFSVDIKCIFKTLKKGFLTQPVTVKFFLVTVTKCLQVTVVTVTSLNLCEINGPLSTSKNKKSVLLEGTDFLHRSLNKAGKWPWLPIASKPLTHQHLPAISQKACTFQDTVLLTAESRKSTIPLNHRTQLQQYKCSSDWSRLEVWFVTMDRCFTYDPQQGRSWKLVLFTAHRMHCRSSQWPRCDV